MELEMYKVGTGSFLAKRTNVIVSQKNEGEMVC
jgi:hypothetical protein